MKITFSKYHGTGNDFIMIDNSDMAFNSFSENSDLISKLCHRRYGIGADGLILLNSSDVADFEMKYYNSDGNPGTMCGNGGRCSVAFANDLNKINGKTIFISSDGSHTAEIISKEGITTTVKLQMQDVQKIKKENNYFVIDTGSPHYVVFTENVDKLDVYTEGRKIRYSKEFSKNGINVNFAEIFNDYIFVRTYERGVEDETLSCGTGATAVAVVVSRMDMMNGNPCSILTPGGKLYVHLKKSGEDHFKDIWLEGPAVLTYKGEIIL